MVSGFLKRLDVINAEVESVSVGARGDDFLIPEDVDIVSEYERIAGQPVHFPS